MGFGSLPPSERLVRLRNSRVHDLAMRPCAGSQFNDITIRIAEVDRANKAMVDRPTHRSSFCLRLLQHALKGLRLDPERYVQIQRVLLLEIERQARHLKEGEARAVIHLEEGMKRSSIWVGRSRIDL